MKLVAALAVAAGLAQDPYVPARMVRGDPPPLPPPTVVAGGQVLMEAWIDQSGRPIRTTILRTTPPYDQAVTAAVMQWEFDAARASQPDGTVASVPSKVLVAAVYRPPTFPDGATLGQPPEDLSGPSADVAYPSTIAIPPYPPLALAGSVVMFELEIDERGSVSRLRPISSDPGFDSAAMDAIWSWKFRAPAMGGRPVRSTAYVIFGFCAPQMTP
jgi:Gram-negative bacterial TonB protein C-terminal